MRRRVTSHRLVQAYRQAPWRTQIQWIVTVLIVVIGAALVALVYLGISNQTATAGLEIQNMQDTISQLQQQIADQNSKLAWLTSATLMKAHAQSMGFEMAMPQNELLYCRAGLPGPVHGSHCTQHHQLPSPITYSPQLHPIAMGVDVPGDI